MKKIVNELMSFIVKKNIDPELDNESKKLSEKVRKVLEKRDYIVFAYIFGSRVHGRYMVKEDVDVAIYTERKITWREFVEIMNELEDEVKTKVDLVDLNTAPLALAYEIVRTGIVVLDRRPEVRIEYEVKILKEYLDLKPRLEQYFRILVEQAKYS